MPYYQYEVHVETRLSEFRYEMEAIEKKEEDQFDSLLSQTKNKIIDLLDIFFPPRFKKKAGWFEYYPTLPMFYRKRALELLQARIKARQIEVAFDCSIDKIPGLENLAEQSFISSGFTPFKSYAVVDYDREGKALIDGTTLLGSLVDTAAFVELLIECDILPFELLNIEIILNLYLNWNEKRLSQLITESEGEEGWLLIDAVSYAAGFYAKKSWVARHGWINGFSIGLPLSCQPLRWKQDIGNTKESPSFQRPKGRIDSGQLPEVIINLQKRWNEVFKNAQEAMKFEDIKHTNRDNVNRSDTRVREGFFCWAREKGYKYPTPKKLPKQKQKRTNLLHQIISDHRKALIDETDMVPSNEAIWSSIYKAWKARKIPFIDEMTRWGSSMPEIEWTTENGNPNKPRVMSKKSFQSHISKYFSR